MAARPKPMEERSMPRAIATAISATRSRSAPLALPAVQSSPADHIGRGAGDPKCLAFGPVRVEWTDDDGSYVLLTVLGRTPDGRSGVEVEGRLRMAGSQTG
jgi:hypothetical protein